MCPTKSILFISPYLYIAFVRFLSIYLSHPVHIYLFHSVIYTFLPASHPHNSSGISTIFYLPSDTGAYTVLKSTNSQDPSKVNMWHINDCWVWNWFSKFHSGNTSQRDEPRQGRSSDFDLVLVECNPRKCIWVLARDLNISQSSIYRHLKKEGKVNKFVVSVPDNGERRIGKVAYPSWQIFFQCREMTRF